MPFKGNVYSVPIVLYTLPLKSVKLKIKQITRGWFYMGKNLKVLVDNANSEIKRLADFL